MAEDYNGDVDRAMAAFAALPMRYNNFATTPAVTGNPKRVSDNETASGNAARPVGTVAFPLLLAALPEISQSQIPSPPSVTNAASPMSRAPVAEAKKIGSRSLDRFVAQPSEVVSAPQQPRPAAKPVSSPGLSPRHTLSTQTISAPVPVPTTVQAAAKGRTTPIAAMFHALHAETPAPADAAGTKTGLQDIFSRL